MPDNAHEEPAMGSGLRHSMGWRPGASCRSANASTFFSTYSQQCTGRGSKSGVSLEGTAPSAVGSMSLIAGRLLTNAKQTRPRPSWAHRPTWCLEGQSAYISINQSQLRFCAVHRNRSKRYISGRSSPGRTSRTSATATTSTCASTVSGRRRSAGAIHQATPRGSRLTDPRAT